ncbi:MAG: carbohydrate deacetylase [Thermoguttaceae bacterium]
MAKYLIVNADDLGMSVCVNAGIVRARREGILTSASLMANMPAFEHAVEQLLRADRGLGIGVHLCLTSGRPLLPPRDVPLLVDARGVFAHGFWDLWRLLRSRHREQVAAQIAAETAAQVARIQRAGFWVDHLDSHQHVHMIPELFPLVVPLAESACAAIRIAHEQLEPAGRWLAGMVGRVGNGGIIKRLVLACCAATIRRRWASVPAADHYFGVLDTGRMNAQKLKRIIQILPPGVSEITVHPGLVGTAHGLCSRADRRFVSRPWRAVELAGLLDPALRDQIEARAIRLVRYQDVLGSLRESKAAPASIPSVPRAGAP